MSRERVDQPLEEEDRRPLSRRPLVYVVAMDEPGVFRDVTRRYTRHWAVACHLREKNGAGGAGVCSHLAACPQC